MAGTGPAPKDPEKRARRNATVAMTGLPAAGRKGRAPAWPLGADIQMDTEIAIVKLEIKDLDNEISWEGAARRRAALRRSKDRKTKRLRELEALRKAASRLEREIWTSLWKTPQATQWEKRGWFREVALFARHQAKAESGSLDDAKEARQREDRLGLNDQAMLRLRWEIREAPAQSTSTGSSGTAKRTSSRRARPAKVIEFPGNTKK